jgi:O-acetylserine/cysteine efflux transporter
VLSNRRRALLALATAGALWGLTVPLSKLSLGWLDAGWLTVARFALAAPLLAVVARRGLRGALTPGILASGAIGYGGVILLQNGGIAQTSVSHGALIVGAVPALVAVLAASARSGESGPAAWTGYGIALAGVALVAGGGGSGTSLAGDGLVLGSVLLSAAFIVIQPRLLAGRDPMGVTAVQLGAGALAALPAAAVGGAPPAPLTAGPVVAVVALALAGTLVPFALFAYGQANVPAELAGAFVNLEPLVGAATGAVAFHDAFGAVQGLGAAGVVAGIALSTLPRAEPSGGGRALPAQ